MSTRTVTRKTVYFSSKTHAGVKYKTMRARDGKVACHCPAWVWNQKCWHTQKVKLMK